MIDEKKMCPRQIKENVSMTDKRMKQIDENVTDEWWQKVFQWQMNESVHGKQMKMCPWHKRKKQIDEYVGNRIMMTKSVSMTDELKCVHDR